MKKTILLVLVVIIVVSGCQQIGDSTKERDFIQENTGIHTALLVDGFDALVDTTADRVLVRFELPADYVSEAAVLSVLATASAITQSENIVVQIYRSGKKAEEVRTTTQNVLDVVNDKVAVEDFLNTLDWKKY